MDGKIRGPGALQEAVDVGGHDPGVLARLRRIGQQPADVQESRPTVDEQREAALGRELSDPLPLRASGSGDKMMASVRSWAMAAKDPSKSSGVLTSSV